MGAIVSAVVGLIALGVGIYFLVKYNKEKKAKPWWIWALIAGGIILILIGIGWFLYSRSKKPKTA